MSVLRLKSALACLSCLVVPAVPGLAWSKGSPTCSYEGTLEPSLQLSRHLGSNPRVWHGMKIFAASIRPFLAEVVMPLLQFQPAFLGVLGVRMREEITWVAFTWGV